MAIARRTFRTVSAPAAAGVILTAALALMTSAAHAADYFAAGLTRDSAWEDIFKTTRIHVEFPFVGFGNVFVPLQGICVDDQNTLRPIDASLRARWLLARESPLAFVPLITVHRVPEGKDPEGKMILLFHKQWNTGRCSR
jgi:hypothetical protein